MLNDVRSMQGIALAQSGEHGMWESIFKRAGDEAGKARSRRACGHSKRSGLDPGSSGAPSALSHHHFPPGKAWAAQCPQGKTGRRWTAETRAHDDSHGEGCGDRGDAIVSLPSTSALLKERTPCLKGDRRQV